MNPMALMKIKNCLMTFQQKHPGVIRFFTEVGPTIKEGSVLELKVIDENGKEISTNMRVSSEDIELFQQIRELGGR